MTNCLYTADEVKAFIKEIDATLLTGISKSDLDSGQSRGSFTISTRSLQIQKEQWMTMLKQLDPACYHALRGPSLIQFKESIC